MDRRTDVFSLGVTLYELLTLCRPYAAASTRDELRRVVRVEPLRPEAYNSSIPRDLSAIVLRCLEKDPARRYQTTAELAADLRAFLAYQPVKARHVTPVGRAARWIRREPLRASLLLTLILALLGALGTWSYLAGKQRYIERGEAVERAEQIELALAAGFRRVMSGSRISAAVADFGGVLTLDSGNTAAVVGLILTLIRTNNHARAATELATAQQRFVAAPVFDRLDAYLQAARGGRLYHRDWRAAQPEPGTVLDCFLSGIFEYEYAVYAADRSAGRRAYGLLDRACLMSPVRRRYLLCARAETSSYHPDHEIARDAARVLEALWPTAEDARYSRALALAEVDPDAAIRLFTELSATDPTGYAYRDHGELLMRRGDFDGAVESFRAALALGPESADFLSSMAEALRKQGKPDLALVQIERAVAAMPGRPVLHFNLGVVLRDLGRSREAVAAFATAARLTPQDHLPHNEISRLQADLGDLPAAIQARRAAVDAAPDDLVLAYRNDLAVLLIRAGQHGQAERVFADLLRQTPDDRDLRRNYGICLVDLGRKQEGFAELRRCIEEHPKWPEAYLALGGLLMLEGEVVEATRLISRGMTLRAGQRPAPKPR
jgi:tetratricopeptide (TPR) repeat protein